ncbi:hypothetical protein PC9H_009161 [Pleurotus ostreatus]|uniref:Uncharacterized protein n=2 Tax=Pleurotus ostreatus TaxID=5322 RepID=A0A067NDX2_PLEO1|nr:uncharacterized protein PC9H_009161 [Pleurotus ostreatus]KAF7426792.1 hypothetical protein PC9H_009161 [Pleurotus ostreatus]KDQ21976.1 hypothetical protein PLEOSDRAFT_1087446 [Pleurotus ostreatus PC15]
MDVPATSACITPLKASTGDSRPRHEARAGQSIRGNVLEDDRKGRERENDDRLVWGSGEFVCEGDARSIFNQLEYKPYDHWQSDVEHKTVGCGIAESKTLLDPSIEFALDRGIGKQRNRVLAKIYGNDEMTWYFDQMAFAEAVHSLR